MPLSDLQQAHFPSMGYTTFRPLQGAMDAGSPAPRFHRRFCRLAAEIAVLSSTGCCAFGYCDRCLAVDFAHEGQVDTLVGNGVPATLFNSSLSSTQKSDVVAGLRQGRYKLLYVSPERLVGEGSESFLAMLSSIDVSFVAIDEAHCISQWGHDFRPEYRQLGRLRQLLPGINLHAYTATRPRACDATSPRSLDCRILPSSSGHSIVPT